MSVFDGFDEKDRNELRRKAYNLVRDVTSPFHPICPAGYTYDESQAKCVPIITKVEPKHQEPQEQKEEGSMYFHSRNDIPENPIYTNMTFNGQKFKKEDVKSFSFTVNNNIDPHTGFTRGQRTIEFEVETKQGGKITGNIQTGDPTFKPDDMYKILGIPKDTKPKGYVEPYKKSFDISDPNIKEPHFIEEAESIFLPNSLQHELSDSIKRAAWLGHTGTFHSNLFTGTVETKQKLKDNKVKAFQITIGKKDEDGDFDYNTITKTLSKDSPIMKIARVPKSKMKKIKPNKPKPISKRKQKEIEKENKYKQHPIEY